MAPSRHRAMAAASPPLSFSRYTAIGAAATAVHYGVLVTLVERCGLAPAPAAAAGALCGAATAYAGNRRFTFASSRTHAQALPRFLAVALASALTSALLVWLLAQRLGAPYLLAQAVATALTLLGGYLLNKRWTFPT
jgi:putative flippase GtrA